VRVAIVTDPELTGSTVELIQKFRPAPINSVERIRDGIVQTIYAGILNDRLREIATRSNAPFLGASTDFDSYVGGMSVQRVVRVMTRDDALIEGFRAALIEVERIAQHGVTAEELDRRKKLLESQYRQALITRSKIPSASYAADYVTHFVTGRTPASVEAMVALSRALLEGITEEDVAELARRWKSRENLVVVALVPEKEGVQPPTAEALLGVLDDVSGSLLAAEMGDTIATGSIELMAALPTPAP